MSVCFPGRSARPVIPNGVRHNFYAEVRVARFGLEAISIGNIWSILISVSLLSAVILGGISIEGRRIRPGCAGYKPLLASICLPHLEISALLERVKYGTSDIDSMQAGT